MFLPSMLGEHDSNLWHTMGPATTIELLSTHRNATTRIDNFALPLAALEENYSIVVTSVVVKQQRVSTRL